ncbi:hypothetical protein P2318_04990 [Myxococcaceae bacterium GXIMD 01537]
MGIDLTQLACPLSAIAGALLVMWLWRRFIERREAFLKTLPSESYTRDELAKDLRLLLLWEVRSREDLKRWYAKSFEVQNRLTHTPPDRLNVPEFIWHYLADADTRFKDPAYAQMQNARLAELLDELERQR